MATTSAPEELYFTPDQEANRLIATDPNALLIGFALDQQVTVQKAFSGPLELKRRLGTSIPPRIAATPPERAVEASSAPARRSTVSRARWPSACRSCARRSPRDYDGDGGRVWTEAASGADLRSGSPPFPASAT